jgi:hypothetical protein
VLAVVETRVSGLIADRVIGKLKFENSVRVEAVGRSGGIWLLWNGSKVDLKVLKTARHLIHVVFDEGVHVLGYVALYMPTRMIN